MKLSNSRLQFAKTEIEQCVKTRRQPSVCTVHLLDSHLLSVNLLMKSLDYKLYKYIVYPNCVKLFQSISNKPAVLD